MPMVGRCNCWKGLCTWLPFWRRQDLQRLRRYGLTCTSTSHHEYWRQSHPSRPPCQGISASPSGRLPSRLFSPTGSLEMGIPAEVNERAIKSLTAWCLAALLEVFWHTRPCNPWASAGFPHLQQLWATETEQPRRRASATRTASSKSLNPQEEIGKARSQSPLCGAHAAKNRAIWSVPVMKDSTSAWAAIMPGLSPNDCLLVDSGEGGTEPKADCTATDKNHDKSLKHKSKLRE